MILISVIKCLIINWGPKKKTKKKKHCTAMMYVFGRNNSMVSSTYFKQLMQYPGRCDLPFFGVTCKGRTFFSHCNEDTNKHASTTYELYEDQRRSSCWKAVTWFKLDRQKTALCTWLYGSVDISDGGEHPTQAQEPLKYHTITSFEENRFYLVGGLTSNRLSSNRMFEGALGRHFQCSSWWKDNPNLTISWKELDFLHEGRHDHVAFKFKKYIVVAGGSKNDVSSGASYLLTAERYDLVNKQWEEMNHALPFPIIKASVLVDPEEKFAIITGGYQGSMSHGRFQIKSETKNKVVVYTELNGFVVHERLSSEQMLNSPHMAVLIS